MQEKIKVSGMNCSHCVGKVSTFVGEVSGVKSVSVNLENGSVDVEFEAPANLDMIKEAIEDSGFEVID